MNDSMWAGEECRLLKEDPPKCMDIVEDKLVQIKVKERLIANI